MMPGMPMMGMGGGGWFFLLILLLVVVLVFVLLRSQQNQTPSQHQEKRKGMTKSAHEIADERLAAGDISREEYRDIIDELEITRDNR